MTFEYERPGIHFFSIPIDMEPISFRWDLDGGGVFYTWPNPPFPGMRADYAVPFTTDPEFRANWDPYPSPWGSGGVGSPTYSWGIVWGTFGTLGPDHGPPASTGGHQDVASYADFPNTFGRDKFDADLQYPMLSLRVEGDVYVVVGPYGATPTNPMAGTVPVVIRRYFYGLTNPNPGPYQNPVVEAVGPTLDPGGPQVAGGADLLRLSVPYDIDNPTPTRVHFDFTLTAEDLKPYNTWGTEFQWGLYVPGLWDTLLSWGFVAGRFMLPNAVGLTVYADSVVYTPTYCTDTDPPRADIPTIYLPEGAPYGWGNEGFNVAMVNGAGEIQLTYPSQRGGLRFHALDYCHKPSRLVASDSWKLLDDFRTVQFSFDSPSGGYALMDGVSTYVVATYVARTEPRASDYTNARHISLNVDSDDMTRSGIHMK